MLLLVDDLDLVEEQDDALALVHLVFGGVVFFDGLDHILELDAVLAQVFAHVDEFFHGHRHFHKGVEHVLFTVFYLLSDDHFAVAVEQGNRTHFAQVHAHRVGIAGREVAGVIGAEVEGEFQRFVVAAVEDHVHRLVLGIGMVHGNGLAFLLGIHDGDIELVEQRDDLFEVFGRAHLSRNRLADFLHGEVARSLALCNKSLYLLDVFKVIGHYASLAPRQARAYIPAEFLHPPCPAGGLPLRMPYVLSSATVPAYAGWR